MRRRKRDGVESKAVTMGGLLWCQSKISRASRMGTACCFCGLLCKLRTAAFLLMVSASALLFIHPSSLFSCWSHDRGTLLALFPRQWSPPPCSSSFAQLTELPSWAWRHVGRHVLAGWPLTLPSAWGWLASTAGTQSVFCKVNCLLYCQQPTTAAEQPNSLGKCASSTLASTRRVTSKVLPLRGHP